MRTFFFTSLFVLFAFGANAQPGDHSFRLLLLDNNKIINGLTSDSSRYRVLGCTAEFPTSTDSLTGRMHQKWEPDLSTMQVTEQLVSRAERNDSIPLPYPSYYSGRSSLNTHLLMVVRDGRDTMIIIRPPADAYVFLNNYVHYPSGYLLAVPYPVFFKKGIYKLNDLRKSEQLRTFQDRLYMDYLERTAYKVAPWVTPTPKPQQSPAPENSPPVSEQKQKEPKSTNPKATLNKDNYHLNDTIILTVTGTIMLNGGCNNNVPIRSLERLNNGQWETVFTNCCDQLDCGKPHVNVKTEQYPLFILTDHEPTSASSIPNQVFGTPGKYRVVVYGEGGGFVVGEVEVR